MAYLARPELMPPADACDGRTPVCMRACWPIRCARSPKADIAALADADARENWTFMMNFRDRLVAAPSLEAVYVTLARKGAGDLPPIFLSQLCHLILRNALEGCDDPYMLRAAELFYRSQLATVHDGTLLLADAEVDRGAAARPARHPCVAAHGHAGAAEGIRRDGRDGRRQRLDLLVAFRRPRDGDEHRRQSEGSRRAVPGDRTVDRPICSALPSRSRRVASIEDRDWRWFIGLDSEGTRIGNALWNGAALEGHAAERIVALMRLTIEDARLVDERVGSKPVYLILAMGADKVVRLKPQNLVAGLPLAATANVA